MQKRKFFAWLLGVLIVAIVGLSLIPASATAAPLFGFTDTPAPQPTEAAPTQPPPPGPETVDPLITKRASVERAMVGDTVRYTLEVTNPNRVDIHKVVITDQLPEVLDLIGTNTPQGTYSYDETTRTLTYNIGTLTAGQVLQIPIVTRVNSKATAPNQFSNLAILTWDDGRTVTSNTVVVTIIPGSLPATGEGPGWREIAVMAGVLLAIVGLAGYGASRLIRRV